MGFSTPHPAAARYGSHWIVHGQIGQLRLAGGRVDVDLLNGGRVGRVDNTLDVVLPVGGLAGGVSARCCWPTWPTLPRKRAFPLHYMENSFFWPSRWP
jgi:hypothetical protein